MVKVITYGTYDMLHYGHINLLKRAKALGDYLIVGVTADDFDKNRGKINVQQSLMERVEAVRATGLADEIIIEEYEGQKIDDIRNYGIDIFTVGSDWVGKFDYLKEYCKVVYLERTEGVSSTDIRKQTREINLGIVGKPDFLDKYVKECSYVNGINVAAICTPDGATIESFDGAVYKNYSEMLPQVSAVYLLSEPADHYRQIKEAILLHKHILCQTPVALSLEESKELHQLAEDNKVILMDSLKTAYSTAYTRLLLLAKSGKIGDVVSVDATATSLKESQQISSNKLQGTWNSMCAWGPITLLPVFHLLGTDYSSKCIVSHFSNHERSFDTFSKIDFVYKNAVASIKVGKGVKSEGELIISGTKGYIYVPAPWWKTEYFEVRYENPSNNKRYFYQLEGEGIRYEFLAFAKAIQTGKPSLKLDKEISDAICAVIEDFYKRNDLIEI